MSLMRRKPPKKRRGEKDRKAAYIRRVEKDADDPAVSIPRTKSIVAEKARKENLDKSESHRQAKQGAKDETKRKLTPKEKRRLKAAKIKAMKNRAKKKKKSKETAKKVREIKVPTSRSYGVGGYND